MKALPFFICLFASAHAVCQTGSIAEPIRFIGGTTVDPNVHEGRLRYAIGTENIQTMRANRTHPEWSDGNGWTYNHGSNLCYWNGQFFQQYLSNPADEHIAPGQTLLISSTDGRIWGKPRILFPPYQAPPGVSIPEGYHGYMMHQRMGFYVAPDGRLLSLAFYGHTEDPFNEGGIGRVVREVYKDGSFGPIYFIRYESHAQWNASNTSYPFYTTAPDTGFVRACTTLLNDPLMTFQWYDEDNGADGFYHGKKGLEALSYYHRKDGKVVALWKFSSAALSADEGRSFSPIAKVPTLIMSGGKQWGQRTADGGYAVCYNPIENSEYRYPLVIVSGDDGIIYDHMLLVQGEVPPRRFSGRWKDFGPCYMRGIEEGNGTPPGNNMWLSYTMNKEDVWISRIPVPVKYAVSGPVQDHFDGLSIGGPVTGWNIYSPAWAPAGIAASPAGKGNCLRLLDRDPYDYSRAIRVFRENTHADVSLRIFADTANTGRLDIDLTDQFGNRPVRICFDENGKIMVLNGDDLQLLGSYQKDTWYTIRMRAETVLNGTFSVSINGKELVHGAQMAETVKTLERLSLRTGPYRDSPNRHTPNETNDPPLAGADEYSPTALFYVDDVMIH